MNLKEKEIIYEALTRKGNIVIRKEFKSKDVKKAILSFEEQLNADIKLCITKELLLEYIKQLQINYKVEFGDWKE